MTSMTNISPIDGRYQKEVEALTPFFSEMALMKYRVKIEVEYLISLSLEKSVKDLSPLTPSEQEKLRTLFHQFSTREFQTIKKIEEKTHHDVKAVEYFLRRQVAKLNLSNYQPWIHFALTSEDVNNLAYALMWQGAVKDVYLPVLTKVQTRLRQFARRYQTTPLLALTHGQPATPTSLGKELAVFASRLNRQRQQLKNHILQGKLSGATGTWSAHAVAYPKTNWIHFSQRFIQSLRLDPNLITTQIESHDSRVESYHILIRINFILLDLCRDLWFYISRGIFSQKVNAREVGSSTMPHKVNPIHFENAEGNLGLANTYFSHLAQTLPVSRLQRDLSGSTVIRNQGMPLAHSLLACKNILKGLDRLTVNRKKIQEELNDHWEVLAEAIQTVLRKSGDRESYERLKTLSRGKTITKELIHSFVQGLDLPEHEKQVLLSLTPETYTGLASKIVEIV